MNWQTSFSTFWRIFAEQDGYIVLLKGIGVTMMIATLGLLIGICIGVIIAAVKVLPKYKMLTRIFQKICDFYVSAFRGTPLVVQLLLAYYVIPGILGLSWLPENVCIIVFGLNSGAYVSEIMRSGILSVDPGQMEAGRALGLSYPVTMLKIVIPQAIKNIIPTLGNEYISLVKETSIVSFVTATDICKAFREIGDATYEYVIPYLFMAVIYIAIVLILTLMVKLIEARLRRSEK